MNKNSYLCKFISENEDWEERLSKYPFFIHIKKSGDLAIFNYDMIATDVVEKDGEEMIARIDFTIPEVQESRGIIINTKTCEVVCWPFRKFGNFGESYVDKIDWNTACVQEKVDGSIMKLWFDKRPEYNLWRISTNGVIDAYTCKSPYNMVYGKMFFEAAQKQHLDLDKLNIDNTYIFELVGPYNRVVIEYPETMIYHTGTRNNITGKEEDINIGIIQPKRYKLNSLEDCIEAAKQLNTINTDNRFNVQNEGFVVVDGNFNRIKIKSPQYVAVHHAFNGGILSKKRAIDMLLANEDEEYLTYFPEYKPIFDELKSGMEKTEKVIEKYCEKARLACLQNSYTRKEFAIKFGKDNLFAFAMRYVFDKQPLPEISHHLSRRSWIRWIDSIDNYDFDKLNKSLANEKIDNSVEKKKER